MSLVNPKPGGYAVGGKVASAEMNQLCNEISLALDKSTAGDDLSGVVVVIGSGQIQASVAAAFQTTTPGGLQLAGGATDWPTFSAPRTISRYIHFGPCNLQSGWTIFSPQLYPFAIVGPGTNQPQGIVIPARTGWTLTSVNLQMAVGQSHTSVPAVFPSLNVLRSTIPSIGGSPSPTVVSLASGGAVSFTASTGSTWYAGGLVQQISLSCNQNNVIDESAYVYTVSLFDESGSNSLSGNIYYGAEAIYTATNLAPQ